MKICYVIESMSNSGGMERVLSVCANELIRALDVSILTLCQMGEDYFFLLDSEVTTYDLGLNNVSNKNLLKKRLKEFLIRHSFDVVISLGGIDIYYLNAIKDGSKKIVWFHFAYNVAFTGWLGNSPGILDRVKGCLVHIKRIYYAKKFDRIVVLSKTDAKAWKRHSRRVTLINNPVTLTNPSVSKRESKKVVSVGRLDYAKGFDLLINAWKFVLQKHSDWILDIYGEGELREQLQKQIDELYLSKSIFLRGRTTNMAEVYSKYSLYVMSSRSEALGLVLLEASVCGLPLIAYDCPFGPKDIIDNGKNGILVEKVGDIEGLAEAINKLIESPTLRIQMGDNAIRMINKFSLSSITKQWHELFNETAANN